jgi:putative flippase GtrA
MQKLFAFYWNGVFAKFLLAGGLAALANFASRIALQPFVGFNPAVALAYLVGFSVAFVLNRAFVFPASGKPIRQEMTWFFVFNLIAFPVVLGASVVLRDYVFAPFLPAALAETAAHGCAILVPVVFNFAAHRLVTFAGSSQAGEG